MVGFENNSINFCSCLELARNKDLEERFEDLYHWLNKLNPESMEYSSFNG